ncbi:MAG: helix-turn-helix transcriptional regulator [Prevotella denticola]|uniref:helix-turn-helix transcriptional regulator n=1 Tax=Prevotella denticola TaxID=28129 RepID=UPI001CB2750A|nr:helix-turn-helix transcriptional regulator [Prevotella denticola]MBF1388758.1 helix-turn-helix transcriptional regulator [Prevotella denticola]
MPVINRIKVVLTGKQPTGKWLAEEMGKSENTISKWCSNKVQPPLKVLLEIATLLSIDIRELLISTKSL